MFPLHSKKGYPKEATKVKSLLKMNDWNNMIAEAIGNRYRVWLNGEQVMDYTMEDANLMGPVVSSYTAKDKWKFGINPLT